MVGNNKVRFIKENLKIHDFDYLGNSHKDLPIWKYTSLNYTYKCLSGISREYQITNLENKEIPANFS